MALHENRDFVFFPKVHVVENKLAQMSDACLIGTPRFLFVVPVRSVQSFLVATGITTYGKHGAIADELRAYVTQADLTVDQLEADLRKRLAFDDNTRVFELDRAEEFAMKTGFWGQTKVKMPGDKTKLINIRGKGEKQRAKDFYAGRLSA